MWEWCNSLSELCNTSPRLKSQFCERPGTKRKNRLYILIKVFHEKFNSFLSIGSFAASCFAIGPIAELLCSEKLEDRNIYGFDIWPDHDAAERVVNMIPGKWELCKSFIPGNDVTLPRIFYFAHRGFFPDPIAL